MGNRTCSIDGCESAVRYPSRGWCNTHYQRWKKHGDPGAEVAAYYRTPAERFAALTEVRGDCLVWTGTTDPNGYARISVSGRRVFAHRYAWEQANGPIPDGMYLDHECWNPSCCRPEHLRLATPGENSQYRKGANAGRDLPRNVYRHAGKYQASVWHRGAHHHLGTFDTVEAASAAATAKRTELFGAYAGRGTTTTKENNA